MQKVVTMLWNGDATVRNSGVTTIAALLHYGEFFPQPYQTVFDSQPDDLRTAIPAPETMQKIISMLWGKNLVWHESMEAEWSLLSAVRATVAAFLQYGVFCPSTIPFGS
jgi:hypothetical protein